VNDMQSLCDRLRGIPVAVMSDVLYAMGFPDRVLASSIAPAAFAGRIAGPALCLGGAAGPEAPRPAGESSPGFEADRRVTPGCIAVIATGGHRDGAIIGGNIALSWKLRGCRGVITDAGVRDLAEFEAMGLPVFMSYVTPLSNKGLWSFGSVDQPVTMPGQRGTSVSVAPGDLIHGDADGIVVIPRAHAGQAVNDAEVYESVEQRIQQAIEAGEDREVIYRRNDRAGHIRKVGA
jgi:4-hydroxy-4-methyl-2-oxoglutarate aldolase